MTIRRARVCAVFFLLLGLLSCRPLGVEGIAAINIGIDSDIVTPPKRVVSLYPTASEILSAIGAAESVAGITLHDSSLPGFAHTPIVGGFANPDAARIIALAPDCVIATPFQAELVQILRSKGIPVLLLDTRRLSDGEANIRRLGALMGRDGEAEEIVARENKKLELAEAKVAKLAQNPRHKSLRTVRLMGFHEGKLFVPGDDSFQNEIIKSAGGCPPAFGKNGPTIFITPEQWQAFDPEVVYFCGSEFQTVQEQLARPEWAGVAAVANDRVFSYPCDLTCRAGTQYGYFSLWLSSDLYGKEYSKRTNQVTADAVLARRELDIPFAFVANAAVVTSHLFDVPAKTLVLRFAGPQTILSSLSGWSDSITAVGNHYSSPPSWAVTHHLGLEKANARVLALLGLQQQTSAFLYTGADMDTLAYVEKAGEGFHVGVLATAGVKGNAMRASFDSGGYVEPGTINLIVLTNRELSPAAMARALITATEAKTAALEDLDVRSSYSGTPATGTGTDNVLVVAGNGPPATMTGGHTKLGELMAVAVHSAVREAVAKQNGLCAERDIFQRLAERKISLGTLFAQSECLPNTHAGHALANKLEEALLHSRYAGFLAVALALSDHYERGLAGDTGAFSTLCLTIAGELAGKHIPVLKPVIAANSSIPRIIREALNALATGLLEE